MEKNELVIFDLDGTLVDSTGDIAAAINHTLETLGKAPKSTSEIARCIGGGFKETLTNAFGSDYLHSDAINILREYYLMHPADNSRVYPGVEDVLEKMSGLKMAVLTNKDADISERVMSELGIRKYFESVFGGDSSCLKPDPRAVEKVIRAMDGKKQTTIIVGDMDVDIMAGKNAGIRTCAVTYGIGDTSKLLAQNPDFIVHDFRQLPECIL
jgi:phosphoglycolate phosphatase